MDLHTDQCYRALMTRDRRFDGRFFTGVKTTGVYCRPVCPARTPKLENCAFYRCAAAAQEAGFRPCRRCRPETAPGTGAWRGTSATIARALRLINDGALDDGTVPQLADRLGIGERHLRRLFAEQLGVAPLLIAQTRRMHIAKRLIEETALPMNQIALASSFTNVRRFNNACRDVFGRTPTEIRSTRGAAREGRWINVKLAFRPPIDWAGMLRYFAARAIPTVESVEGIVYRRSIELPSFAGVIEVECTDAESGNVLLRVPQAAAVELPLIVMRVRRIFDLDADLGEIAHQFESDPLLGRTRIPRVPGAWDGFELAVRAILGQQVSVAGATTVSGRLVERFGQPLEGHTNWRVFPKAEALANADVSAIGLPKQRAAAIQSLAAAVLANPSVLEIVDSLEESIARLIAIPGVGPWTAHYIALRVLREPDAFPDGDLALRKAASDGTELMSSAALRKVSIRWQPWRAYAAMALWMDLGNSDSKMEESA